MFNYNKRALLKKLEEQTRYIEKLRRENKELRAENKDLGAKLAVLEASLEARISAAVNEATAPILAELAQKNAELARVNAELEKANTEIARLNAIKNKDSSNSSQPPSQNGFKQIPNNREKSNHKRGGQKGHPGHRLKLPENLDELIEKGIVEKKLEDHTNGTEEYVSRWTMDITIKTLITEHRFPVGQVPPEMYNEVTYGNGIKGLTVVLSNEGMLSEKRLAELFDNVTQGVITVSEATIEKFQSEFAGKLDSELTAIEADLLNGEVMHTDDTPMKCAQKPEYCEDGKFVLQTAEKKSFKVYMRTHSNDSSTLLTVNPKKDAAGIERDGILPKYIGILSHDHERKFYNYGSAHAACGGHPCRELKGLRDLYNIPWAGEIRALLLEMNDYKNQDLSDGKTACDPEDLAKFEQRYDELIKNGQAAVEAMNKGDLGFNKFRLMVKRLYEYKDCHLLFMRDYKAPFTNNQAERDFRLGKTKQKISGCFRSWEGICNYARTRSFISTLKKRGKNILSSVALVFKGVPALY